MKQWWIIGIICVLCFSACTGFYDTDDEKFEGTEKRPDPTRIEFSNERNALSVSVYTSSERTASSKVDEIAGGAISEKQEWDSHEDGFSFYLTYHLSLREDSISDTLPYIPGNNRDVIEVSIPANETTTINIPQLNKIVEPDQALFDDVYLIVENSDSSILRLAKGSSFESPLGKTTTAVNGGDTVIYKVPAAADISGYTIQGTSSTCSLPAALTAFEKGYLYTLGFNGSVASLIGTPRLLTLNTL